MISALLGVVRLQVISILALELSELFFQVIARPREWKSRDESPKTLEYQDDPSLRSDNQRPKECGKELQKYIFMYATALSSRFLKSEDGHISPNQV